MKNKTQRGETHTYTHTLKKRSDLMREKLNVWKTFSGIWGNEWLKKRADDIKEKRKTRLMAQSLRWLDTLKY